MLRRFTNNTVYRTVGYYTIFFYLTLFLFLFLYRFLKLFWYRARHSFQSISDIQAHNTSVYSPKIEFLCASIFYEHFHFNCFFSVWFTVEEGKKHEELNTHMPVVATPSWLSIDWGRIYIRYGIWIKWH